MSSPAVLGQSTNAACSMELGQFSCCQALWSSHPCSPHLSQVDCLAQVMCRAFSPDCHSGYTTDMQSQFSSSHTLRTGSPVPPPVGSALMCFPDEVYVLCPYWWVEPSFPSAGRGAAVLLQYPVRGRATYPRASGGQVQCSMTRTPAAAILPTQHGPQQQLKAVCHHGLGGSTLATNHYGLGGSPQMPTRSQVADQTLGICRDLVSNRSQPPISAVMHTQKVAQATWTTYTHW